MINKKKLKNKTPTYKVIKKCYLCRMEIRRINNGKIFCFGNEVIPKYSFNAKELDEETGMYYFEARYYRAPTFISRDPLMNEKPWLNPYHYCSNNPIGRIDPTGMMDEGYITGEGANEATAQLNASTNLTITRDPETGKLSASGEIKNEYDQNLYNAINDPSIIVHIDATYSNTTSTGEGFTGGAFMGNSISSENIVNTYQTVNPYDLAVAEFAYGLWGTGAGMAHEFMESYLGGQYSQQTGIAADRACNDGCDKTVYDKVHPKAPAQPGWKDNGARINIKAYFNYDNFIQSVRNVWNK